MDSNYHNCNESMVSDIILDSALHDTTLDAEEEKFEELGNSGGIATLRVPTLQVRRNQKRTTEPYM